MNKHTITSSGLSESIQAAQGIMTDFSICEGARVQAYCEERGYVTESVSDACEVVDEDSDRSLRDAHYKWWKRYGDHSPQHAERSKEDLKKNNDKRQDLYRDVVKTNIEKNRSRNQQAHYDKVINDQSVFKKFSPELQKTIRNERDAEHSKNYKAGRRLKQNADKLDSVDFSDDTANRLVLAPHRKHTKHWENVDEATRVSKYLGLDKAGHAASKQISRISKETYNVDRHKGNIINAELGKQGFGTGTKIWEPRTLARKRKDKYGYEED